MRPTDRELKWELRRVMPGLDWTKDREASNSYWRHFRAKREGVSYSAQFSDVESAMFLDGIALVSSSAKYKFAISLFAQCLRREAMRHQTMASKLEDALRGL